MGKILEGNIYETMRIILPEHRRMMLHQEQESKRQTKPILDPERLNDMSIVLSEAIQDQKFVTVTVFKPFGNEEMRIVPVKIDPNTRTLKGVDKDAASVTVTLTDILDIQF